MAQEDSNDVLRGFKDLLTSTAQDQREFQANLLFFFFDKSSKFACLQRRQGVSRPKSPNHSFENPRD